MGARKEVIEFIDLVDLLDRSIPIQDICGD
jgi:hypothetical protein